MSIDTQAMEWLDNNDLAYKIWNNKYRNNNESLDEWFDRISHGNEKIKQHIKDKKFIFGGRILAARGIKDRNCTLSNCYVITPPEDNIESIFDCAKKLARTYSYGGGCGIDISNLRPEGAEVHNAAKTTSGPVSFMDLYSKTTETIGQSGRRGALMISIDINHPDVEKFIDCKTDLTKVNYANISVRMNSDFMNCVLSKSDYILRWPCDADISNIDINSLEFNKLEHVYNIEHDNKIYVKKVNAYKIFRKIAENNWNYAEPGVLYWDRISNYNLVSEFKNFKYAGTNPCAEEPLPAGGSCLLGSINLSEFVLNPFTDKACIDYDSLYMVTCNSVEALNQVLIEGMYKHSLDEQRDSVFDWRQIGLGTMGLADMLIKLGITYGSKKCIDVINDVYKAILTASVSESAILADEYGEFPECKIDNLIKSQFVKDNDLGPLVTGGLFNSQLLTCAPTGSIATMLGVSTGIEPIYAMHYTRTTKSLEGKDVDFEVYTPIAEYYRNNISETLPDYFVESKDIAPTDRIKVQAAIQKYIDASISSTINLPKEATVNDVYNIYVDAYKYGLKGVTVFRNGCARAAILNTEKPKELTQRSAPKRPSSLNAVYEEIKVKGELFAVIIGFYDDKPYEVFTIRVDKSTPKHSGKITKLSKGVYKYVSDYITIDNLVGNLSIEESAATLYTSMLLRHGVEIKYIVKTARKVNSNITSFSSAMCRILSKYAPVEITDEKCPKCGSSIVREGGCEHCSNCEWSKCMLIYTY